MQRLLRFSLPSRIHHLRLHPCRLGMPHQKRNASRTCQNRRQLERLAFLQRSAEFTEVHHLDSGDISIFHSIVQCFSTSRAEQSVSHTAKPEKLASLVITRVTHSTLPQMTQALQLLMDRKPRHHRIIVGSVNESTAANEDTEERSTEEQYEGGVPHHFLDPSRDATSSTSNTAIVRTLQARPSMHTPTLSTRSESSTTSSVSRTWLLSGSHNFSRFALTNSG